MRLRCWGEDHSQCRHPLATFLLNSTSARCNIDTHKTSSVLFGSTPCRELIRPVFSDEWVRTKTKNLPRKIQLASAPEIFSNSWLHFVDRKTCIRRRIADFFEPTGERLRSPRRSDTFAVFSFRRRGFGVYGRDPRQRRCPPVTFWLNFLKNYCHE